MNLRDTTLAFAALSFVALVAGVASAASYFTDLSALTGTGSSYYAAYPTGVNNNGAVAMQGFSSAYTGAYYHSYLYTGGTAPTMNDITSTFGGVATRVSEHECQRETSASLGAKTVPSRPLTPAGWVGPSPSCRRRRASVGG